MARNGYYVDGQGGKNISQRGSSFSHSGNGRNIRMQGTQELQPEQVVIIQVGDPHCFCPERTRRVPNAISRADRCTGYLQGDGGGFREWAPDNDQGAARRHIYRGCEFQRLFTFFVSRANEDGDCEL